MIFGNMGEMMKMAREMQGQLKQIKGELANEIYEANVDGVAAKVSGDLELKDLKLNPGLEAGKLERATKEAVSKALKSAKDNAAKKMKGLTGGLGLPGMF